MKIPTDRKSYFRAYNQAKRSGNRAAYRRRRTPLECKNLLAALRFYQKCGYTIEQMVALCGKTLGGVTPATVRYYLYDPRCKADAR